MSDETDNGGLFVEISDAFGVDLSPQTVPTLTSLDCAQNLIDKLWPAARNLLHKTQMNRDVQQQKLALRELISSTDASQVRHGVELMTKLDSPAIWEEFAAGIIIDEQGHLLYPKGTIRGWVQVEFQADVALAIARHAGLLDGITKLNLSKCFVQDLRPLSGLTTLDELYITTGVKRNRRFKDLSGLEGLPNLTWLAFSKTSVSDLGPLMALTNLTDVFLGETLVSDEERQRLQDALPSCWLRD